ncbi:MAG: hypothetical protein KGO52_07880 [Nitrospirota bacterium]|nr:hypothetical protein [Nitrospirota bacterium]MDE3118769.1 hypothetical protein [Nitrospirota bacterium]MDE3242619.1 hypothetical protein [Nitrospirota bacterium]
MPFAGLILVLALVAAGCTRTTEVRTNQTTIYSSMESTALVYTDPEGTSAVDDHPLRWVAFWMSPFANAFDYVWNRQWYNLASTRPNLFGYTSEDAMLHSQRPSAY